MVSRVHSCPEETEYTLENRGDGWYIYQGEAKSRKSVNFCPFCGEKMKVEKDES